MREKIGRQGVRIHPLHNFFSHLLTNSVPEMTSEEVTTQRRIQRKQFKLDRARAIAAAAAEAEAAFAEGRELPSTTSADGTRSIPSAATWKPQIPASPMTPQSPPEAVDDEPLVDMEHLQLTLVEAFFLLWNLECLTVYDAIAVSVLHIVIPFLAHQPWFIERTHDVEGDMDRVSNYPRAIPAAGFLVKR